MQPDGGKIFIRKLHHAPRQQSTIFTESFMKAVKTRLDKRLKVPWSALKMNDIARQSAARQGDRNILLSIRSASSPERQALGADVPKRRISVKCFTRNGKLDSSGDEHPSFAVEETIVCSNHSIAVIIGKVSHESRLSREFCWLHYPAPEFMTPNRNTLPSSHTHTRKHIR